MTFSAMPFEKCDSRMAHIFNGLKPSKMAAHPVPHSRVGGKRAFCPQPARVLDSLAIGQNIANEGRDRAGTNLLVCRLLLDGGTHVPTMGHPIRMRG